MTAKRPRPDKDGHEKGGGSDRFSHAIDRPSRADILDAALERLRKDLEDVRKLTQNA